MLVDNRTRTEKEIVETRYALEQAESRLSKAIDEALIEMRQIEEVTAHDIKRMVEMRDDIRDAQGRCRVAAGIIAERRL